MSDNHDNFFLPKMLQRLCQTCQKLDNYPMLQKNSDNLIRVLNERLNISITLTHPTVVSHIGQRKENIEDIFEVGMNREIMKDIGDDGPVVLSLEEVEASQERSSNSVILKKSSLYCGEEKHLYSESYPCLFAAILQGEDVLMTCARILDEKADVTLVREAADYLKNVEAKRKNP